MWSVFYGKKETARFEKRTTWFANKNHFNREKETHFNRGINALLTKIRMVTSARTYMLASHRTSPGQTVPLQTTNRN